MTIRDDLRAWAEAEVREGRYGSPDELVNAALDRVHGEAQRKAALKAVLDEGDASGVDPRPVKQISADIRREYGLPDA